jgi:L-amino acid N-acyltransferase YncA
VVRDATPVDAAACAEIYAPYVRETVVSFEAEPPTTAEMARRIAAAQEGHAWLVLEDGSGLLGYAYGGPFKARQGYRFACEVSVYLGVGRQGTGAGRQLYEALLPRLQERGYRTAAAIMTMPNAASAGLHRAFGFEQVGLWRQVGWKFDAWHDVAELQLDLGPAADPPVELR